MLTNPQKRVQLYRGTDAIIKKFTGLPGEVVYNLDTNKLHTNDGLTTGGHSLALSSEIDTLNDRISDVEKPMALALAVILNEHRILPIDETGAVTDYTGTETEIAVFYRNSELEYDGQGTTPGYWTVRISSNNIQPGVITKNGRHARVSRATGMINGAQLSNLTYTITGVTNAGAPFTLHKQQTFTTQIGYATNQVRSARILYSHNDQYTSLYDYDNFGTIESGYSSYVAKANELIYTATSGLPINNDVISFSNGTNYNYILAYNERTQKWIEPQSIIDGSLITDVHASVLLENDGTKFLASNNTLDWNKISYKLNPLSTVMFSIGGTNTTPTIAGLKLGDISWNADSLFTGTGLAITSTGIVGYNGNKKTLEVKSNGDAVFSGDISGSTGTLFGKIESVDGKFIIDSINKIFSITI